MFQLHPSMAKHDMCASSFADQSKGTYRAICRNDGVLVPYSHHGRAEIFNWCSKMTKSWDKVIYKTNIMDKVTAAFDRLQFDAMRLFETRVQQLGGKSDCFDLLHA